MICCPTWDLWHCLAWRKKRLSWICSKQSRRVNIWWKLAQCSAMFCDWVWTVTTSKTSVRFCSNSALFCFVALPIPGWHTKFCCFILLMSLSWLPACPCFWLLLPFVFGVQRDAVTDRQTDRTTVESFAHGNAKIRGSHDGRTWLLIAPVCGYTTSSFMAEIYQQINWLSTRLAKLLRLWLSKWLKTRWGSALFKKWKVTKIRTRVVGSNPW